MNNVQRGNKPQQQWNVVHTVSDKSGLVVEISKMQVPDRGRYSILVGRQGEHRVVPHIGLMVDMKTWSQESKRVELETNYSEIVQRLVGQAEDWVLSELEDQRHNFDFDHNGGRRGT